MVFRKFTHHRRISAFVLRLPFRIKSSLKLFIHRAHFGFSITLFQCKVIASPITRAAPLYTQNDPKYTPIKRLRTIEFICDSAATSKHTCNVYGEHLIAASALRRLVIVKAALEFRDRSSANNSVSTRGRTRGECGVAKQAYVCVNCTLEQPI